MGRKLQYVNGILIEILRGNGNQNKITAITKQQ
jgi:hypothetical protein